MINFPLVIMACLYGGLSVLTVYALHKSQLCGDKVEGVVRSELPTRSLLTQKERADKTALSAILLMGALTVGLVCGLYLG